MVIRKEVSQQTAHALVDVVHNLPDDGDVLPFRVFDRPILVSSTDVEWARLTTAHGDNDVISAVRVECLRYLSLGGKPESGKHARYFGVNLITWFRAR